MNQKPDASFLSEILDEVRHTEIPLLACKERIVLVWTMADPHERAVILQELLVSRGVVAFMDFIHENEALLLSKAPLELVTVVKETYESVGTMSLSEFSARIIELLPDNEFGRTDLWYVYIAGLVEAVMPAATNHLPGYVSQRLQQINRLRLSAQSWERVVEI